MKTTTPEAHPAAAARRRWFCSAAAALLLLAALPASAFDLGSLMAMLAQQRSGEAAFTEQRHVQGLDAPLSSSGVLSFQAPDHFVRRTLEPRPETMVVDGNQVTLSRAGRSRRFSLDAAPETLGLIEAIRGMLTGNGESIRRFFKAELSGGADNWRLLLTPRQAGQVEVIRIAGRHGELSSIEMDLLGGDRSLMTIEPLRAGQAAARASTP